MPLISGRNVYWVDLDGWRLGHIELDGKWAHVTTFRGVEKVKFSDLAYRATEENYDERFLASLKRHSKIVVDSPVTGSYYPTTEATDEEIVIGDVE